MDISYIFIYIYISIPYKKNGFKYRGISPGQNKRKPPFFGPEASKDSNDFKEAEAEVEDPGNLVSVEMNLSVEITGGNHQS